MSKIYNFPKTSFRPTSKESKPIKEHVGSIDSTMKSTARNIARQRGQDNPLAGEYIYRRMEQRERIAMNKSALGKDKKALHDFYKHRMGGVYTQKDYSHIYGIYQDGGEKMYEEKRPMDMQPGDLVYNNLMGEIGILQDNQDRGREAFLIFQDRSFKVEKDAHGWSTKKEILQEGDGPVAASSAQGPALFREQIGRIEPSQRDFVNKNMKKIQNEVDSQDDPYNPKNDWQDHINYGKKLLVQDDWEDDEPEEDDDWEDDVEFADAYQKLRAEGKSQRQIKKEHPDVWEKRQTGAPQIGPVSDKKEGQKILRQKEVLGKAVKEHDLGPGDKVKVGTGIGSVVGTVGKSGEKVNIPKSFDTKAQKYRPFAAEGQKVSDNVTVVKKPQESQEHTKPKVTLEHFWSDTIDRFKAKKQNIEEQMSVLPQAVRKGANVKEIHKLNDSKYQRMQHSAKILGEKIASTEKYLGILKSHSKDSTPVVKDKGEDINKYEQTIKEHTSEKGGKLPQRPGFKSTEDKSSYAKGVSGLTGTKQEKQHRRLMEGSQPLTALKKGEQKQISPSFTDIDVDKLKRSDILITRKGGKDKPTITNLEDFPHHIMGSISKGEKDIDIFVRSRKDTTVTPQKRSSYIEAQKHIKEAKDKKPFREKTGQWSSKGFEEKRRTQNIPVAGGPGVGKFFGRKTGEIHTYEDPKVRKTGTPSIRTQKTDIEKSTDLVRVSNIPGIGTKSFTESAKKTFDFGGTPPGGVVSAVNKPEKGTFDRSKNVIPKTPSSVGTGTGEDWIKQGRNPHAEGTSYHKKAQKQINRQKHE